MDHALYPKVLEPLRLCFGSDAARRLEEDNDVPCMHAARCHHAVLHIMHTVSILGAMHI